MHFTRSYSRVATRTAAPELDNAVAVAIRACEDAKWAALQGKLTWEQYTQVKDQWTRVEEQVRNRLNQLFGIDKYEYTPRVKRLKSLLDSMIHPLYEMRDAFADTNNGNNPERYYHLDPILDKNRGKGQPFGKSSVNPENIKKILDQRDQDPEL